MCVIGWAHLLSSRFPLIWINNRDELASRETEPLSAHQLSSGRRALYSRDSSIPNGGTWCGVLLPPANGNHNDKIAPVVLAALTSSARCPSTTPLGASAFSIVDGRPAFVPPASRGRLIVDCLARDGEFPLTSEEALRYGGFNFFTFDLRKVAASDGGGVRYFTNRFGLQFDAHVGPGVHAVANSFLDHDAEPKCSHLRTLLKAVVEHVEAAGTSASIEEILAICAAPLCATPNFEEIPPEVVDASRPFAGLDGAAKAALGVTPELEARLWSVADDAKFHANIYQHVPEARAGLLSTPPNEAKQGTFVTLTQTIVLVERRVDGTLVVHHAQRGTSSPDSHAQWQLHSFPVAAEDK